MTILAPDGERLWADWERLSQFRDESQPGWTRRPFTPEYRAGREWLAERMAQAGLEVMVDAAGNLIGRRAGQPAGRQAGRQAGQRVDRAPILVGSHSDTVTGGGRFDGIAGVLGALEVARCLQETATALTRPLEVVDFLAEEPTDFGISCVGSRGMTGTLDASALARRDPLGKTLAAAIASVGGRPDALQAEAREPGSIALSLELHIEQGPVLEGAGVPLGVVTGIVGIERFRIDLRGQPDHAGTMPMDRRRDALAAAAEVVLALEGLWRTAPAPGGVGTAGRLFVSPNAGNVIPGAVELWAEQRSIDAALLARQGEALREAVRAIGERRGVEITVDLVSREEPVPISTPVQDTLAAIVRVLGLPERRLASYAGHDSMHLARIAPAGIVFVRSKGGASHRPEEWTDRADWMLGVKTLAEAVVDFDRRLT